MNSVESRESRRRIVTSSAGPSGGPAMAPSQGSPGSPSLQPETSSPWNAKRALSPKASSMKAFDESGAAGVSGEATTSGKTAGNGSRRSGGGGWRLNRAVTSSASPRRVSTYSRARSPPRKRRRVSARARAASRASHRSAKDAAARHALRMDHNSTGTSSSSSLPQVDECGRCSRSSHILKDPGSCDEDDDDEDDEEEEEEEEECEDEKSEGRRSAWILPPRAVPHLQRPRLRTSPSPDGRKKILRANGTAGRSRNTSPRASGEWKRGVTPVLASPTAGPSVGPSTGPVAEKMVTVVGRFPRALVTPRADRQQQSQASTEGSEWSSGVSQVPRRGRGEGGMDGPAWWFPLSAVTSQAAIVRPAAANDVGGRPTVLDPHRPLPPPGRRPAGDCSSLAAHAEAAAAAAAASSTATGLPAAVRRPRSRTTRQVTLPSVTPVPLHQEMRALLEPSQWGHRSSSLTLMPGETSSSRTEQQRAVTGPMTSGPSASGTSPGVSTSTITYWPHTRDLNSRRAALLHSARAARRGEATLGRRAAAAAAASSGSSGADVAQMGSPLPPAPSVVELENRELTWARGRTFCFAVLYLGLSASAVGTAWQPWAASGESARAAALAPLRRRFFASEYGSHYALVCMMASMAALVSTLTERAALVLPLVALGAADLAADCAETALGCASELTRLGAGAALVYALVAGSLLWAEATLWMGCVRFAELAAVRTPTPQTPESPSPESSSTTRSSSQRS